MSVWIAWKSSHLCTHGMIYTGLGFNACNKNCIFVDVYCLPVEIYFLIPWVTSLKHKTWLITCPYLAQTKLSNPQGQTVCTRKNDIFWGRMCCFGGFFKYKICLVPLIKQNYGKEHVKWLPTIVLVTLVLVGSGSAEQRCLFTWNTYSILLYTFCKDPGVTWCSIWKQPYQSLGEKWNDSSGKMSKTGLSHTSHRLDTL